MFTENLLLWYAANRRELPWKQTKDPYIIWLSEIILQQTRVEQGTPYFMKFAAAFPTVKDLAAAEEDKVMRLWEGLGYYSRARNLHYTAKYIANELDGQFPDNYKGILALKGVGPYTAAAIASFAYGLPHAVVDGNVYRVLARFFGETTPIDSTEGKKKFAKLADTLLHKEQPDVFNQAIMDFGSLQCTPKNPNCPACPLMEGCVAFAEKKVATLPIKSKKIKKKDRYFYFLVIANQQKQIYIQKRQGKDIWQNLYQFPLIETSSLLTIEEVPIDKLLIHKSDYTITAWSDSYKQLLTHQRIYAQFIQLELQEESVNLPADWIAIDADDVTQYAFPKVINRYLTDGKQKQQQMTLF